MEDAFHLEKNPEISVGAKVYFPIGKKLFLFRLVLNPGAVPVTRRDTKMAADLVIILDELVDEEVKIQFYLVLMRRKTLL